MPWDERSVKMIREEFVKHVLAGEKTKTALCQEYGISRPTGDKWLRRYRDGCGVENLSRRPHKVYYTDTETENLIVNMRKEMPAIGATKIRRMLENDGHKNLPCPRTINNIFQRNGLITREASLAATPYQRFEKSYPNEMWQADYLGHFAMKNMERCHPLNIIDDNSRYLLCCKEQKTETFNEIKPVIIGLFEQFGLPFSFLCDNGNPWGTSQSVGFTAFEVWMMELGILVLHGRPRHPQTQGKDERFNGSMQRELLKYTQISDWEDAAVKFEEYRQFYNHKRPHHALQLDTPATRYCPSDRAYSDLVKPWEYEAGCQICKVKDNGYVNYCGQGFFLSEAFRGKEIAIRPSKIDGCISLFFRQFRIARFHLERRVYTLRRAYLIQGDPRTNENTASKV